MDVNVAQAVDPNYKNAGFCGPYAGDAFTLLGVQLCVTVA